MKVRCNECMWEGDENSLYLFETKGDGAQTITAEESPEGIIKRFYDRPENPFFFKGCPNCKTDANLMDIE